MTRRRGAGITMRLDRASAEFLRGYFSTHDRRGKTEAAYRSDLAQFQTFAGGSLPLPSLGVTVIENWAAHLRRDGYSPASIRRKMAVLKVFCSYWVRRGGVRESPFWRGEVGDGRGGEPPRGLPRKGRGKRIVCARR